MTRNYQVLAELRPPWALPITNLDQTVLHSATHLSRPAQLLQDSRDDPRAIVTPVVTPKFLPQVL